MSLTNNQFENFDQKSPSNLVELVRKDLELEKELKQFEDSLEEDKLVNI